jgi:hypothetical protein
MCDVVPGPCNQAEQLCLPRNCWRNIQPALGHRVSCAKGSCQAKHLKRHATSTVAPPGRLATTKNAAPGKEEHAPANTTMLVVRNSSRRDEGDAPSVACAALWLPACPMPAATQCGTGTCCTHAAGGQRQARPALQLQVPPQRSPGQLPY